MTAITQFNMSPDEVKVLFLEVLKQASGTHPAGTAPINPDDVADQSAEQAAKYLRCSRTTLINLVSKYPEHLRPIIEEGKAVRYKFAQLHYLKSNNLVK